MLHVLQILCQFFSWHSEYYCYLVLILRDLGSLKNEVKRGLLRKTAAFKSLHVQGLSYALYFINETNIHSLFVFILIYSVQLKVKVKTSLSTNHRSFSYSSDHFKTKTVNDHSHTFLISKITSYYTMVLLTHTILIPYKPVC